MVRSRSARFSAPSRRASPKVRRGRQRRPSWRADELLRDLDLPLDDVVFAAATIPRHAWRGARCDRLAACRQQARPAAPLHASSSVSSRCRRRGLDELTGISVGTSSPSRRKRSTSSWTCSTAMKVAGAAWPARALAGQTQRLAVVDAGEHGHAVVHRRVGSSLRPRQSPHVSLIVVACAAAAGRSSAPSKPACTNWPCPACTAHLGLAARRRAALPWRCRTRRRA